ncbi:M23 family metallopeptidase [Xanthobacter autotrophicus]|uniref:M23 family metallopeptidase n=1 Tax=Xanthobacter autotrophicus TaxID=280 RepID=UPI0024A69FB8|nr:M23 family metallopeptidase [Xanthobacter autotrophicus]MDI4658423.1 M23 family metallopeptidase [Xanthobacter autotrophicus]
MRISSETHGRNVFARLALIGLVSGTVAGCSSDSTRFLTDGFTAPPQQQATAGYGGGYQGQQGGGQGGGDVTGSLGAAPSGRVDAVALPPPGQGGTGIQPSSYASSGATQPLYGAAGYGAAAPVTASARPAVPGTHVVVGGETLASVARMYGVTPAALGAANNIAPGHTVRTGQTLVIPPGGNGASQAHAAQAAAQPALAAKPPQVAAAPQTLTVPGKPASQPATVAAKPLTTAPVLSQNLTPPPAAAAAAKPAPAPKLAAAPTQAVAKSAAPEPKVETAAKVSPVADADDAPRASGSGPQFRAPVRGRVIASFGPKPGGAHNDGVNFAVPEGTGVRSAEDGTVAYAGNELKGYGNLVLVKHADGYVTAYAHNSELNVKRGDTVRRGQIIAKAGQSGNVTSPQLHFEIRKGSTAVDPSRYVAGL